MLLGCHICISLYWPLETITTPIFVGQEKYLIQGDYYIVPCIPTCTMSPVVPPNDERQVINPELEIVYVYTVGYVNLVQYAFTLEWMLTWKTGQ